MADHFLSKIRVANDDFVEAGGQPVLEQYSALRAMLAERAGPEVADLFAEPLISRGNDEAPPTVSWYTPIAGEARPLEQLPPGEKDRAERYLADHLRPLRALADDPASAGLAQGALSVMGQGDVAVVGDRPVIVNWGLMPGGKGASAAARPAHYAATLGRFLPLGAAAPAPDAHPAAPSAAPVSAPPSPGPYPAPQRVITALTWMPLVLLLLLAGAALAWLLMPGNRLFPFSSRPAVVTDAAALSAAQAENDALRARRDQLQVALESAVCRDDGQLILPDGLTPEGLTPPEPGVAPETRATAVPDALLPSRSSRVAVPDGAEGETTLLDLIEQRTVLVLAGAGGEISTGSGLIIGPGLIVTNHHVVEKALGEGGQILVAGNALDAPLRAKVLKTQGPLEQTGGDFALLEVDAPDLPAFIVHLSDTSLKLSNVVAAGYPGDVLEMDVGFAALKSGDVSAVPDVTVTDGTVNTEQKLGPETNVLMHSAPLSRGNSGGPLVDMCGRLVGVNSFVRTGRMQNRGFALSSGDLMRFLEGTPAAPTVATDPCAPVVLRPDAPAPDPQPKPASE
ncbi:S1C family serine protease [Arenibacterium sp. CAU 1754]